MSGIDAAVVGGSWITSQGYGRLGEGVKPVPGPGRPVCPAKEKVFSAAPSRYGRFDEYTRLGYSAVALALGDAGLEDSAGKRPIGIVSSSAWESMVVDLEYYRTTDAQGGALASPNLFSYTLPGIVHGECAVHFKLTGPTICVGEEGGVGINALRTALRLMAAKAAPIMIAGWLDDPPQLDPPPGGGGENPSGALFVVLESDPRRSVEPWRWIRYRRGSIWLSDGTEVTSLLDLFGQGAA